MGSGCASASSGERTPFDARTPLPEYDARAVAPCLRQARELLRAHDPVFEVMASALDHPPARARACPTLDPAAPFAAFEGWWRGQWRGMPVAHLWLTVAPGVQLVLLDDDGSQRHGINLRTKDGQLCGLVVGPDGHERPHQGRVVPARAGRPAHLVWATPDRVYYERIACRGGRPTYEIHERPRAAPAPRAPTLTAAYDPGTTAPSAFAWLWRWLR